MIKNSILSEGYLAYIKAKNASLQNISNEEKYITKLLEDVEEIYEGENVNLAKMINFRNREDIMIISNINESLEDIKLEVANKTKYTLSEALEQSDAMYKTLHWEKDHPVEHVTQPEGIVDSIFGGSTELDRATNEVDIKDTKKATESIARLADDEYDTKVEFEKMTNDPKPEDKEAMKECVEKLAYYQIIRESVAKKIDGRNRNLRKFYETGKNRPDGFSDEELDDAQAKYNKYLEKKKAKAVQRANTPVESNLQSEENK